MGIWSRLALTDRRIYTTKALYSLNSLLYAFHSTCRSRVLAASRCASVSDNLLYSVMTSRPPLSTASFKLLIVISVALSFPSGPPLPVFLLHEGCGPMFSRLHSSPLSAFGKRIELQPKLHFGPTSLAGSFTGVGPRILRHGCVCQSLPYSHLFFSLM